MAIEQGTLWTCPWFTGRIPPDRSAIKELERGDIVFHHEHKMIRAVSVVIEPWRAASRPVGYPTKRDEDHDNGWLVRVQPLTTSVQIPLEVYQRIVRNGEHGPLTVNGTAAQKYLSPLTDDEGTALLALADLSDLVTGGAGDAARAGGGATDRASAGRVRVEQAALRAHLLGAAGSAACGLCGRVLPAELLVAGHIKPRALCSEEERWDFDAAAMLFCLLGCDVLFEKRYVTVDGDGQITEGRPTGHATVLGAVAQLTGQPCSGFTAERAPAFSAHAELAE
ncbi:MULTISPECIES: hypothetical protein [Tsukamurella]|uniref:HNH endonuclease n=1 Tax=Tsukamurella asaccharolytica TaxID=2592067 RepID=A0A5C5R4Q8_9ACTN|nr:MULTISPECIES: hypothetical protein [Tsukamurella]TWS17778.1 hypothetical protein FK529_18975 [Tsukamurella asaccharolytica]